jgi:hypothetical protein
MPAGFAPPCRARSSSGRRSPASPEGACTGAGGARTPPPCGPAAAQTAAPVPVAAGDMRVTGSVRPTGPCGADKSTGVKKRAKSDLAQQANAQVADARALLGPSPLTCSFAHAGGGAADESACTPGTLERPGGCPLTCADVGCPGPMHSQCTRTGTRKTAIGGADGLLVSRFLPTSQTAQHRANALQ